MGYAIPRLSDSREIHSAKFLDRFCELTGFCKASAWRYEKRGWLKTHLLANRRYILAADVAEFNRRLAADEFAETVHVPTRKHLKS